MNKQQGFAVQPKLDCPHAGQHESEELVKFLTETNDKHFSEFACGVCQDKSQNWICMNCHSILCSRYVKSHMVLHNQQTKHPVALSFSDASFWCYQCDSYIENAGLKSARVSLGKAKFSAPIEKQNKNQDEIDKSNQENEKKKQDEIVKDMQKMSISKKDSFTMEELIKGISQKKYENVVILTGAGLSVAAGIPDFRTPGIGLYSKLQKYNLPTPQAIFTIDYYKKNPQPFMDIAKEFIQGKYKPTKGHQFIKKFQDQKILLKSITQNIDGLQLDAGLMQDKLIQAHGHSRSLHCLGCSKQGSIEKWKQAVLKSQPLRCECGQLMKPDITFFGQALPKDFAKTPQLMELADLVIIMGTSLAVMPFAFLAQLIKVTTPVVLINNTDSLPERTDKLWLDGDLQNNVEKIMKGLAWL